MGWPGTVSSKRENRRSAAQHGAAKAGKPHFHFGPVTVLQPYGVSSPAAAIGDVTKPGVAGFGGTLPVSVERVGRPILVKSIAALDPSSGVMVHAGVSSHPTSRRARIRRRRVGAASGPIRNPDADGAPGTPTELGLVVLGSGVGRLCLLRPRRAGWRVLWWAEGGLIRSYNPIDASTSAKMEGSAAVAGSILDARSAADEVSRPPVNMSNSVAPPAFKSAPR